MNPNEPIGARNAGKARPPPSTPTSTNMASGPARSTTSTTGLSKDYGRWRLAIAGVVSIVFGVLLAIAPVIGAVVLTWWLGAYALAFGIALLVLAFQMRPRKDDNPRTAAPQGA
jgi:MFS family permease